MATIQVRVDDKLKEQADALFADIGLDTSTAIRAFLKQSLLHQGLPFALVRDTPNAETRAAIEEMRRDMEGGKAKSYTDVDEMMRDLLK